MLSAKMIPTCFRAGGGELVYMFPLFFKEFAGGGELVVIFPLPLKDSS